MEHRSDCVATDGAPPARAGEISGEARSLDGVSAPGDSVSLGSARPSVESLRAAASARSRSPSPSPDPIVCAACQRALTGAGRSFRGAFTQCALALNAAQFRRDFIWMTARGRVFRVPREWAEKEHPGGFGSLEKGGIDANEAFLFHSSRGQETWARFEVGYLVACAEQKRGLPCTVA